MIQMTPIGDIARSYALRTQSTFLRAQISQHTQELSSGRSANILAETKGNTGELHVIRHDLRQLTAFQSSIRETKLNFEAKQTAYDSIGQSLSPVIDAGLSSVGVVPNDTGIKSAAKQAFAQIISTARSGIAGQTSFAWSAGLPSGNDVLSDFQDAISSSSSEPASEVIRGELFDFFNSENTGSSSQIPTIAISQNRYISASETTPPESLLSALSILAETALSDTPLSKSDGRNVATALMVAHDGLVQVQADLGQKQEFLEITETQNAARQTALKLFENELTAVDPFDVVTKLQDASLRLEALYATTARLSQLSLTRFL